MKTALTIISLVRSGKHLIIKSPYDQELVEDIKGIHYKQREFDRKENIWKILEDDPEQNPDQETNLEYVKRICRATSDRRGWEFNDFTSVSADKIQESNQKKQQNLKEEHIKAICEVLPQLPHRALRLVRWNDEDSLSLQLNYYLGAEKEGLWHKLREACQKTWKARILNPAFDSKMDFGFVFEISSDSRVIQALIKCSPVDNLIVHELSEVETFQDSTAHLKDLQGTLYVAQEYDQVLISEFNVGTRQWELSLIRDKIYWVAKADHLIKEWLTQSITSTGYFGGSFGVFFNRKAYLPEILSRFHLEEYFKNWAIAALNSEEITPPDWHHIPSLVSPGCYDHVADNLLVFLTQFKDTTEGESILNLLGIKNHQEYQQKIRKLKEAAAEKAYEEILLKSPQLAEQKLNQMTRKDLEKLAQKYSIEIKKSYSKSRIVEELIKDLNLCKKLIGLKEKSF